jgi:hypothetical protein
VVFVRVKVFSEPQLDFCVGGINGVTSVADVASYIKAVVTTDGAWGGVQRTGFAKHLAAGFDGVKTFPYHAANWAGGHVFNKTWEKFLFFQVSVVLFKVFGAWRSQFQGNKLETTAFEATNDATDKTTLDAVWLDHNVGAFGVGHDVV